MSEQTPGTPKTPDATTPAAVKRPWYQRPALILPMCALVVTASTGIPVTANATAQAQRIEQYNSSVNAANTAFADAAAAEDALSAAGDAAVKNADAYLAAFSKAGDAGATAMTAKQQLADSLADLANTKSTKLEAEAAPVFGFEHTDQLRETATVRNTLAAFLNSAAAAAAIAETYVVSSGQTVANPYYVGCSNGVTWSGSGSSSGGSNSGGCIPAPGSVTLGLEKDVIKHLQKFSWRSEDWFHAYGRRDQVEMSKMLLKHPGDTNQKDGAVRTGESMRTTISGCATVL
ncbi:hypothetical protein [Leucobacter sp. VD1]|uniref:hypothetical protein n=1 Tax=Leucobacter sp. VD1 TaxID=3080381 RepID=UPI003018ED53